MADSGDLTMLANNDTQEAIAPMAAADWMTLTATGNQDINVLVYVSGYQTAWADGDGWAVARRYTIGPSGMVERVAPAASVCVRVQGPVGEGCRVVLS